VSTARPNMLATRVSDEVKSLVAAVSERRLLKPSELLREYLYEGIARDVIRFGEQGPR
jgi:hypothetical protein